MSKTKTPCWADLTTKEGKDYCSRQYGKNPRWCDKCNHRLKAYNNKMRRKDDAKS